MVDDFDILVYLFDQHLNIALNNDRESAPKLIQDSGDLHSEGLCNFFTTIVWDPLNDGRSVDIELF